MSTQKINKKDLARARAYIKSVEWRFAKTMPQWPHFYTVLEWNPNLAAEFFYFAYLIHKHGYVDPWGKRNWVYFQVDEFKYWVIDNILNRADSKPNSVVMAEGKKYLAKEDKKQRK
jgi:hypothetical protein